MWTFHSATIVACLVCRERGDLDNVKSGNIEKYDEGEKSVLSILHVVRHSMSSVLSYIVFLGIVSLSCRHVNHAVLQEHSHLLAVDVSLHCLLGQRICLDLLKW